MIKLYKQEIPVELAEDIKVRTAKLLDLIARNQSVPNSLKYAYKDAEIKKMIQDETNDKCAYCESKILHISFGDVEHIVPKSVRPELTYTYENLTLACSVCNNKKGNYYDPDNPTINPYEDEPSEHLMAEGMLILRVPGNRKGQVTERILDLNRTCLLERRKERLMSVARLADTYAQEPSETLKTTLALELAKETAASEEFSFVIHAYVSRILDPQHKHLLPVLRGKAQAA